MKFSVGIQQAVDLNVVVIGFYSITTLLLLLPPPLPFYGHYTGQRPLVGSLAPTVKNWGDFFGAVLQPACSC